jgi:hypothetical protein
MNTIVAGRIKRAFIQYPRQRLNRQIRQCKVHTASKGLEPPQRAQPDFNMRSVRGDAVLRWDYRSGSSLYVVSQQQRSDFAPLGDFDGRRDVCAIFRTMPTNVFLVKATY